MSARARGHRTSALVVSILDEFAEKNNNNAKAKKPDGAFNLLYEERSEKKRLDYSMLIKLKFAKLLACSVAVLFVGSCAGRDAHPVAVSQPQDTCMACAQIQAEIVANNKAISDLGSEKGAKVAQNVAAGVVGILIWPVWFAMDFKGAAATDQAALESRNQYLATMANTDRCGTQQPVTTAVVTRQPAVIAPAFAAQPLPAVIMPAFAAQPQPAVITRQPVISVPAPVVAEKFDGIVEQPLGVTPVALQSQPVARNKLPPIVVFTHASDATRADQSADFDDMINAVANGAKPPSGGN